MMVIHQGTRPPSMGRTLYNIYYENYQSTNNIPYSSNHGPDNRLALVIKILSNDGEQSENINIEMQTSTQTQKNRKQIKTTEPITT
jgi:hypothetical protein